jgi:4-aminobutyrate aminotransferase-like enzyme
MVDKLTTKEYMEREKKLIYSSTVDENGPVLVSGKGAWVWDIEGRRYLDFSGMVCLANTGHCPEPVVNAITDQAKTLLTSISADWPFYRKSGDLEISRVHLAEKLIEITDHVMPFEKRVGFEVSGATAVNFALKLAKISYLKKQGKWDTKKIGESFLDEEIFSPKFYDPFCFSFLVFKNAFHGRHGDVQCLTNTKPEHLWAASSSCAFGRLDFPSKLHSLEGYIKKVDAIIAKLERTQAPVVAFMFEPIQGEGGVNIPDKTSIKVLANYLRNVRNIYIIADEIQTGFGRTGPLFACHYLNITPDILVLSKALGSGLPIGAIVANAELFPDLEPGMHSGSHHCTPTACAAALANIELIKETIPNVIKMGRYAMSGLKYSALGYKNLVTDIRGSGLMIGIEFVDKEIRDAVILKAKKEFEHGLILAPAEKNGRVARFYPPLNILKGELNIGINLFSRALKSVHIDVQRKLLKMGGRHDNQARNTSL